MGDSPAYPPPPDLPPEAYEQPVEPPPAYAGSPPPAGPYAVSRNLTVIIAAVVVFVVLVVGIGAYVAAGYAFAANRISATDNALLVTASHRSGLDTAFGAVGIQFGSLSNSSLDTKQARALSDKFVADSQNAGTTAEDDDHALAAASATLDEQQWLTVLSRGRIEHERSRVVHARAALGYAKTLASDYVQVGRFLQSYFDAATDLQTMETDSRANNLVGAAGANATLQTHVAAAVRLSNAPGLPADLQKFVLDLQSFAIDFGKLLNAYINGDQGGYNAALKLVDADATKLQAFDVTPVASEIAAYYQPLRDDFISEMDKATV